MNCPKCGKPIAGGAAFCMHCGQWLGGGAVQAPQARPVQNTTQQPAMRTTSMGAPAYAGPFVPPDVRKRNTVIAVAVALVVLLMLVLSLKAAGILKFGANASDGKSLIANGSAPDGDLLKASGQAPKGSMQATKVTMPQNIKDWLEHLARIERKKRALTKRQEEEMKDMIGELNGGGGLTVDDVKAWSDPDSNTLPVIEKAASIAHELQPAWLDLKREFDSVPPPPECVPIAQAYDQGLADIPESMKQVEALVSGTSTTDQDKARESKDQAREISRNHRAGIDQPFAKTDDLVQAVCDKYQTRKWFDIDAHGGGRGVLGF